MIHFQLENDSYIFYREGELGINLDDLKKVLTCLTGDNSTTRLIFGKERLFITIHSKKYKSEIPRTLEGLDLDLNEILMEQLLSIDYPIRFSLDQAKFLYTLKNLVIYSEVVEILLDDSKIVFRE